MRWPSIRRRRRGYGLYSRAARSMMTGAPIPVGGLKTLREALNRVGIATAPARMERAYNAGGNDPGADQPRGCRESQGAPQDRLWRNDARLRA